MANDSIVRMKCPKCGGETIAVSANDKPTLETLKSVKCDRCGNEFSMTEELRKLAVNRTREALSKIGKL